MVGGGGPGGQMIRLAKILRAARRTEGTRSRRHQIARRDDDSQTFRAAGTVAELEAAEVELAVLSERKICTSW